MTTMFELKKKLAMRPDASPKDLDRLCSMIRQDPTLAELTLPVIYHHLSVEKIPRLGDLQDRHECLARAALRLLSNCLGGFEEPRTDLNVTRNHWDRIWAWCSYTMRACVDTSTSALDDTVLGQGTDHHHNMWTLMVLANESDLRQDVISTPDLLPLLMDIWKLEGNVQGPFVSAAQVMAEITAPQGMDALPELPDALSGSLAEDFTTACLQRIETIDPTGPQGKVLIADLCLMIDCTLVEPSIPQLQRLLLAKNSFGLVLNLMRRLCHVEITLPLSDPANALVLATYYLVSCCESEGLPYLLPGLEERLLPTVLKVAYCLRGQDVIVKQVSVYLLNVMRTFLIHRSVLLHARKSLKTFATYLTRRPSSGPEFWDKCLEEFRFALKYFHECTDEWTHVKNCYDASGIDDSCSNSTHPRTSTSTNGGSCVRLKRCGGCYTAYYCSRACRKSDWENGHKEECAQLFANRSEGYSDSNKLSSRDSSFLRYAVVKATTRGWSRMSIARAACAKEYPDVDPTSLVMEMDFTHETEMLVRAVPRDRFDREGVTDHQLAFAFDKAVPGKATLFCAILPFNAEPFKILFVLELKDFNQDPLNVKSITVGGYP